LKTLYRKRTVIWPFYFYTIIRTLSKLVYSFYN
ncbi:VOC family protein, partial [Staphylococcus epidermidis]